jgi:hypothetical protein
MDKTVARLNIEYFRKKLQSESDGKQREMLLRLLAEEEAKLAALMKPPSGKTAKQC